MKLVFATANTQVWSGGVPVSIVIGQHWSAEDPIVKAYPSMFSTDARYGLAGTVPPPADVEQATANPGELRTVSRPGESADEETERLRTHLERLGVKPDRRWTLPRLREEAAKAEDAA